jgi:isochorismate hydrolase
MKDLYLTEKNISTKADEWLKELKIPLKRINNFKFNPKNSALIVIDMQRFFLEEESHAFIPSSKTIVKNINLLIAEYRKRNYPIVFTYHALRDDEDPGIMERWWGNMLRTNNPLSDIHPSIDYLENDIILRKSRYSAFLATNLDKILKLKNINTIVITGIMTHLCCESTARDAFMKDYEVYFVVDATGTDTEDLHKSSLKTLTDGFTLPFKTKTLLEEVKKIA